MSQAFIEDPPYLRDAHESRGGKIDYVGFGVLALWLGTLQIILDRGQQDDWFNATWLCWASVISLVSMLFLLAWELRVEHPLVDLRVFCNRSFAVGTLLMTVVGIVLYSTTALLPLFLQGLMGYPALNSGMAMSPRGWGAICSLLVVGVLVSKIDARLLIGLGFLILAYSCSGFGNINLEIATKNVTWPNILSGVGMGFIFVPLTTTSMGALPNEQMGNAAGVFNLMRNIGGSIGIAMATTLVARGTQTHQALMVGQLSSYRPEFQQYLQSTSAMLSQHSDPVSAQRQAYGLLYGMVQQQANLFAYVDTFRLLALLCLLCIPIVFLLKKVKSSGGPIAMH
jgi:DHA2 family multidrug resistance protein